MAKNSNNPEVRFANYNEDWVEKEFHLLFNGISNNSLSRDKLNYYSGNAKNVHYGDILVKYKEILDVKNQIIPYVNDNEVVEKLKSSKLIDGDIILSDAAEDETVGKCVEIINVETEIVLAGLHTIALRPKLNFAPKYLGYYLNSDAYHDQLLKLMQGTKVLSVSKTSIKNTVIRYPENKSEQSQLGNFFQNLDQLITQHQQKLTKLQTLKKAMLDKMFPKDGATVPEIRFKEFTDDWEPKKLSTFTDKAVDNRGKTPPINNNGNHPLIEVASLGYGAPDYSKISKHLDDFSFNNFLRDYIKKGDILFSTVGSIGLVSLMDGNENAAIAQNIVAFRSKDGFIPEYLYALFSNQFNKSLAQRIVMGAVQPSIKVSQLVNVKYCVTKNIEEQQKIGDYFKNLDALIKNHNEQLTKLSNLKKACLVKMFV